MGSVVDFWKNRGTISTSPPMATTSTISTIIRKLLVSIFSCEKVATVVSLSLMSGSPSGGLGGRHPDEHAAGVAMAHGHPGVPGHHAHAGQVQQPADHADHVEGIGRLDGFDEGVGQRAVAIERAPHQALHHAGD